MITKKPKPDSQESIDSKKEEAEREKRYAERAAQFAEIRKRVMGTP